MKNVMSLLLCLCFFVVSVLNSGCAGRDPNPIAATMPGDENRSCDALLLQRQQVQKEMELLKPKTNKFLTNTAWLLMFPFLMDLKDAEKIEYDAFRQRSNHLTTLMLEKGCDTK